MKSLLPTLRQWQQENLPIAVATVTKTWGSSPRKAGAKMLIAPGERLAGSVSGGCIEGAVYHAGLQVLENGRPQLLDFGVADETAWEVGLACGGSIQVWVESLHEVAEQIITHIEAKRAFATLTVLSEGVDFGQKRLVSLENGWGSIAGLDDDVIDRLGRDHIAKGSSTVHQLNDKTLFIDVYLPAPQLIIVGGVHIAVALADIANTLNYTVTVIDPRRAFASAERFPHIQRLIQLWPDTAFEQLTINPNSAIALLTHDPKIDDPAILAALPTPAFYIGALGSRKTHAKRVERLLGKGVSAEQIARLHAPIGLNIGATTPEEIALAVMAEIIATRRLTHLQKVAIKLSE